MRTRSGNLEAQILGGDLDTLVVQNEAGVTLAVPRRDIREIDHPGNVVALVGGILAGVGGIDLAIVYNSCRNGGAGPAPCIATGTLAAVGAGMLTWGLWVWLRSRFALDPGVGALPTSREPNAWPVPGPASVPAPPLPSEAPSLTPL